MTTVQTVGVLVILWLAILLVGALWMAIRAARYEANQRAWRQECGHTKKMTVWSAQDEPYTYCAKCGESFRVTARPRRVGRPA